MFCYGKTFGGNCQQTAGQVSTNSLGFSLLEIMIVVVIAVILAGITFPIYSQHLVKKKRLHAEMTLQRISSALETYFVANYSYEHFSLSHYGFPENLSQYHWAIYTDSGHY